LLFALLGDLDVRWRHRILRKQVRINREAIVLLSVHRPLQRISTGPGIRGTRFVAGLKVRDDPRSQVFIRTGRRRSSDAPDHLRQLLEVLRVLPRFALGARREQRPLSTLDSRLVRDVVDGLPLEHGAELRQGPGDVLIVFGNSL
jgi:hypothetical protein